MSILEYEALPCRVRFGLGAIAVLPDEAGRLARRMLLLDGLADPSLAAGIAAELGSGHAATMTIGRQHVPAALAEEAAGALRQSGADGVVALGGGSAIGVAKALARQHGIPILAVPTTYAGSEMTPIWGVTNEGEKTTGRDLAVLPRTVIYDPELTVSLSPVATGASGMNAVAHCVEALWLAARTPVSDAFALEGLARLAAGLPRAVAAPADREARAEALRGAWLAGRALALAGTGLHHAICHVLGGSFDLPHAEVHAAVLPAVAEHLLESEPDALARASEILQADDAAAGLRGLARAVGAVAGLAALGLDDVGLLRASDLIAARRPEVTSAQARGILVAAMDGAGLAARTPGADRTEDDRRGVSRWLI